LEAEELTEKPPGCRCSLKHIAFVAAIVASFKATLVRGASVLSAPARSVSL